MATGFSMVQRLGTLENSTERPVSAPEFYIYPKQNSYSKGEGKRQGILSYSMDTWQEEKKWIRPPVLDLRPKTLTSRRQFPVCSSRVLST